MYVQLAKQISSFPFNLRFHSRSSELIECERIRQRDENREKGFAIVLFIVLACHKGTGQLATL